MILKALAIAATASISCLAETSAKEPIPSIVEVSPAAPVYQAIERELSALRMAVVTLQKQNAQLREENASLAWQVEQLDLQFQTVDGLLTESRIDANVAYHIADTSVGALDAQREYTNHYEFESRLYQYATTSCYTALAALRATTTLTASTPPP